MKRIELRTPKGTSLYRLVGPAAGAIVSGLLWMVSRSDAELAPARTTLGACALGFLALTAWAALAMRSGLVVDESGVTRRTAFTARHVRWSDVDGVVQGYFRRAVLATVGGRALRLKFDGTNEQVQEVVDAVLASAPQLRGIAWGLGLDGVAPPAARPALLPDRIQVFDRIVEIRGPGRTILRLRQELPDYARRVECARERLARMILGELA